MKRDIDHDIEGTRIRKKNKNNDETTLHSNIVIGWKKTVASGEYKVKDDTSSAAGTVIVQGLSGKINKSIERHFLNTLPEEKKRFNLTAPKTETQQDTKLNIKTLWAPIGTPHSYPLSIIPYPLSLTPYSLSLDGDYVLSAM